MGEKQVKIKNSFIIIVGMFLLSGCGSLGMMVGGSTKTYTEDYELTTSSPLDVYGKLNAVASEIGYSISGLGKANGTASLARGVSMAGAGLTGSTKSGQISIRGINTRTLTISIMVVGNFSYGSKENADAVFEKISGILKN